MLYNFVRKDVCTHENPWPWLKLSFKFHEEQLHLACKEKILSQSTCTTGREPDLYIHIHMSFTNYRYSTIEHWVLLTTIRKDFYRPQTKFAKVCFQRCLSVHSGGVGGSVSVRGGGSLLREGASVRETLIR